MRDTFSVPGTEISYQTNSMAFLSPPAPASPRSLFANQEFFFCPIVFYQGVEPLLWNQCLDRGAYPVEGYFTFFSQKIGGHSLFAFQALAKWCRRAILGKCNSTKRTLGRYQ